MLRALSLHGVGLVLVLATCRHVVPEKIPGDVTLPDGGVVRRADVAAAIGKCALTRIYSFTQKGYAFENATQEIAYDPSSIERRDAARKVWSEAMDLWEQLEVMQFGPAADVGLPGGKGLRDEIYSWPATRCFVEQNIVSKAYEAPTFEASLFNARGLGSAEYLLFYEGTDNVCAPAADINTQGTWVALGPDELRARRAKYAYAIAADVNKNESKLESAWATFSKDLATAGTGSTLFPSGQSALNAISDALFYIDFSTKDMKVAVPAGIAKCTKLTCPEALESLYAGRSKVHIRNNLLGARTVFDGCAEGGDLGMDDLMLALGAVNLVADIHGAFDKAIASLDAIEEQDLGAALAADIASVKSLYDALRSLTDLLKADFVTTLDLELPTDGGGSDND